MRRRILDVLAALVGIGVVVGEAIEVPAEAKNDDRSDEFPRQRIGGGTHFRERIDRAKLLGRLPGLRKLAAKLREPRKESMLMAYTPPPPGSEPGTEPTLTAEKQDDDDKGSGVSGVRG